MTTYCTQHFDPYKKTTTGKPTSKITPKKQPPKTRNGFKFSCHLQLGTKETRRPFCRGGGGPVELLGCLACAYLIWFRSPMSVQWHQHQWKANLSIVTQSRLLFQHNLCKDSGESSDLPVSFVTMKLSGRTGVNG